jgi:ascorbate-specific PTS system EIIC-type component UlaA
MGVVATSLVKVNHGGNNFHVLKILLTVTLIFTNGQSGIYANVASRAKGAMEDRLADGG